MGSLIDFLLGREPTVTVADQLVPPFPSVADQIAAYVDARSSGISGIPQLAVLERGIELIASSVAQLAVIAYDRGVPMESQPRIVDRPDPWQTRYAFLYQTVRSMIEEGDAAWFLFDHDPESNRPRAARPVPMNEVSVSLDEKARFLPVYDWRGQRMKPGYDFLHIPLAPRVGQVRGISPIREAARSLWAIEAAESFAAGHFSGAGVPSGTINSPVALDKAEAARLKQQWLESHAGPVPVPAVLSGGVTYEPNGTNPEDSQLVETREHGVATIARILGIPAPLLLVSLSSSTVTYQNVTAIFGEFMRSTVAPLYLAPIEGAWSDLVGRSQSVRFDIGEIGRIDVEGRYRIYQMGRDLGLFTPEQVAKYEGIRPPEQVPTPFAPIAAPVVAAPEIPA
jgi:HK97 family phage portal protein